MFATHSIGLARSVADRIYSFRKGDTGTVVQPFEATINYAEFVGELSFSAFKEFGADSILLVEGVTDVKAVQQFLRMLKKDHLAAIVPLGGDQLARGGVEAELGELKRLSTNIFALVDSERPGENAAPQPNRLAFAEVCRRLGFRVCVTKRRAIENYFSDRALKQTFGSNYRALAPYESLKSCSPGWSKMENWRVARNMVPTELESTDLGEFLKSL